MDPISLLIWLIVVFILAAILYYVLTLLPLPANIRTIIILLIVLLLVLYLVSRMGLGFP